MYVLVLNLNSPINSNKLSFFVVKATEKTFGTGRVAHARSDAIQKFTVDTFNPESAGDIRQQERSPSDKPRNRNPRSNRRNQKPKEQVPFQHPTLENITITKASVQERLLKIAKDKDSETKTEPQPKTEPATETDKGN